jgi:hypothetical protein
MIFLLSTLSTDNNINSPDNILMVEPGEEFDLPHDFLVEHLIARVEADPLNGIHLIIQLILHLRKQGYCSLSWIRNYRYLFNPIFLCVLDPEIWLQILLDFRIQFRFRPTLNIYYFTVLTILKVFSWILKHTGTVRNNVKINVGIF